MNLSRLILVITSGLLLTVTAVITFINYNKKKPFYLRLKNKKPLRYSLVNLSICESIVTAELTQGKRILALQIRFLNSEIIHFQINDPHYERYVVKDVVIISPDLHEYIYMTQEESLLHLCYKHLKVTVNCNDFEITISKYNQPILYVNLQKSFIIEEKEPHVGISCDFFFPEAVKSYGLPQHADQLSLTSNSNAFYRLFNTDRCAYSTSKPHESLYGTVPILYAYSTSGTTGLLWLNASDTYVNIKSQNPGLESTFYSESGAIDFFAFSGPNLRDCVRQNSQLTGAVPLPPLFALGYHQCRYCYMSEDEVMEVSNKFDENEFPLDSVWIDIDYTDDMKYFTWNPTTYPNPDRLLSFLESRKRKAVAIIDPHIKVDNDYFVYAQCKKRDFLVKNTDGTTFTAKCWPGISSWIDFFNPEARQFYAGLHPSFAKYRNLHIWNDMNEPALFETNENAMPKELQHFGNWKHRDVHNLYGFYQSMATYDGLLKRPNLRPFVLTRSHFAGSQRFAGVWTGDNIATWDHLQISVPMCLTASLAGFSLCGADIGGFLKVPDGELLQRWYQLGAWLPFFRGHSDRTVPRREPYLYDEVIQGRIRACLEQRYMHLLHWYTLFWNHSITLEPVIRPLVYQYPKDPMVDDLDGQFLVGNDILVCPVMEPHVENLSVYLPGGVNEVWYHLGESTRKHSCYADLRVDMDAVPVFYRGGGIVPMVEQTVSSSAGLKDCPITLYIFCGTDGTASGVLYSDDTESFEYLDNSYHYVRFDLKDSRIASTQVHQDPSFNPEIVLNSVKLFGYDPSVGKVDLQVGGTSRPDHEITFTELENFLEIKLRVNIQQKFIITLSQ